MEYGCVMGYNARRETVHQGHYMLNGLTRANYGSMWKMYRLFMGARAVGRLSYIGTDGDQWLGEATGAEIDGGGSLHVGGQKIHGLCRFHTVNIPLMVVMSKHGFTVAERDFAIDIKDRIHVMFRSCETVDELVAAHRCLRQLTRACRAGAAGAAQGLACAAATRQQGRSGAARGCPGGSSPVIGSRACPQHKLSSHDDDNCDS